MKISFLVPVPDANEKLEREHILNIQRAEKTAQNMVDKVAKDMKKKDRDQAKKQLAKAKAKQRGKSSKTSAVAEDGNAGGDDAAGSTGIAKTALEQKKTAAMQQAEKIKAAIQHQDQLDEFLKEQGLLNLESL